MFISAGNTFTDVGDVSHIYYYTTGGVIVSLLLCLFFFYLIVRARSHGHHPQPRQGPLPPQRPRLPPQEPPRVVRPSRFVANKTTWYTQPPPGYLTVVGSPAYQLEKSIRPGITLPSFEGAARENNRTEEGEEEEPPPYPEDMDELDNYPTILGV